MDADSIAQLQVKLEKESSGEKWTVLDYVREFDALWRDGRDGNLVIVWDTKDWVKLVPELGDVAFGFKSHLTPWDWVLSNSREFLRSENIPKFRVVILDLVSDRSAFGSLMAPSLDARCGWIGRCEDSVELAVTAKRLRSLESKDKLVVEQFRQAWLGSLASDSNRHDVNNLLGPIRLLGRDHAAFVPGWRGRDALTRHAERLNLVLGADGAAMPWTDAARAGASLGRGLRFVLIDDQANNGWIDVICAALGLARVKDANGRAVAAGDKEIACVAKSASGAAAAVELLACTSPLPLLETLEKNLADDPEARDFRFHLNFTNPPPGVEEILLLDLRVIADETEEKAFFESVIALARKLDRRASDQPTWQPLLAADGQCHMPGEGATIDVCLTEHAGRDSESYLRLLTLLPRVIASADLSYPVMLFSSTGQRTVMQQLAAYGTVVTKFEKPRLLGYRTEGAAETAREQWNSAIDRVIDILKGRVAVRRLPRGAAAPADQRAAEPSEPIIDIFTDEQGDEWSGGNITVGGLVVVHRDAESAAAFHDDPALAEWLLDCPRGRGGPARRKFKNWKDRLRSRACALVQCIDDVSRKYGALVRIVELTGSDILSRRALDDGEELPLSTEADELYRRVLDALFEVTIFHFAPSCLSDSAYARYWRVFAATRVRKIQQYTNVGGREVLNEAATQLVRERAEREKETWGIRKMPVKDQEVIDYFPVDAPRSIARAVARRYEVVPWTPTLVHARGYGINTHPDDSGARPLHYLADALLDERAATQTKHWRETGFCGTYDAEFRKTLNAARVATTGFVGKAISVLHRSGPIVPDASHASSLLASRVWAAALGMNGPEFIFAIDDMAAEAARRGERAVAHITATMSSGGTAATDGREGSLTGSFKVRRGKVQRKRSELDMCRIRSDDLVLECRLPLADGLWLFNLDEVEFTAVESTDEGVTTLEIIEITELLARQPKLADVVPGGSIERSGSEATLADGIATLQLGPVTGNWRWRAHGDPRPSRDELYRLRVLEFDGAAHQAELALAVGQG